MVAAVETERLTKLYGSARGIVDVDLTVSPGVVFGFLGPNGAGKTTTIRLLMSFLRPTSGVARVLGLDTVVDRVKIHRRVGYVAGDQAFFERLTAGTSWRGLPRCGEALPGRQSTILPNGWTSISLARSGRCRAATDRRWRWSKPSCTVPSCCCSTSRHRALLPSSRKPSPSSSTRWWRKAAPYSYLRMSSMMSTISVTPSRSCVTAAWSPWEMFADLRSRAGRDVTIRFADPVDAGVFAMLDGIRDLQLRDRSVSMRVIGDLDRLVKTAAHHHVVDLLSNPPDLEEIFLGMA